MKRSAEWFGLENLINQQSLVQGFTLLELLLVIGIIVGLSAVIMLLINPIEIMRRSRDTNRLQDLNNLSKAIDSAIRDSASSSAQVLCFNSPAPCSANSNDVSSTIRSNNGTGWVLVNFSTQTTMTLPTLPLDPINSASFHYTYYSDGVSYELNATLESTAQSSKMQNDGGNNSNLYETGTSLTLIN